MEKLDSSDEDINELKHMIPQQIEEPQVEARYLHSKIKFILWIISAIFMFGTKSLCIGMSKLEQIWIFFFEHLAILITATILLLISRMWSNQDNEEISNIIKRKNFLVWTTLGGIVNALGNIFIIFGIHFSLASGTSPAAMNCLVLTNIVFLTVIGIFWFGERHSACEFVGAAVVISGLVCIAFQHQVSSSGGHDASAFYLAVLFTLCCSAMWGVWAVAGKYMSHHYSSLISEYSFVNMIISGIAGWVSIFYLVPFYVSLNRLNDNKTVFYIVSANFAGVFTVLGVFCFMRALELGGIGVAYLLVNLQLIVEMTEEFLVFGVLPSLLGAAGTVLALVGASIVVLYQQSVIALS